LPLLLLVLLAPSASTAALQAPVPPEISIATWNLKWFFDDDTSDNQSDLGKRMSAPNRKEYQWKLNAVADGIGKLKPTVIVLQEVENEKVLRELAQRLKERHQVTYQVGFVRGFDSATEQNVGILAQSGLQTVRRMRLPVQMQRDHVRYKDLSKHLVAELAWGSGRQQVRLTLLTVHLISSGGEGERIKQGRVIHFWMREQILAGNNVLILGDFNCEIKPDDPTIKETGVGMARGLHTPETADDLTDLDEFLPPNQRDTHASRKPLDRILASAPLLKTGKGLLVFEEIHTYRELAIRGKRDFGDNQYTIPQEERDVSDHYPLVATFKWRR
jgi:endonuclease/exonuclease/phosphatase family metal-dependent hydrolase